MQDQLTIDAYISLKMYGNYWRQKECRAYLDWVRSLPEVPMVGLEPT